MDEADEGKAKLGDLFELYNQASRGDRQALGRLFEHLSPLVAEIFRLSRVIAIGERHSPDFDPWEAAFDFRFRLTYEFRDAPVRSFEDLLYWIFSRAMVEGLGKRSPRASIPRVDAERLKEALDQVDELHREVLVMRLLRGRGFRVIAEWLKERADDAGSDIPDDDWAAAARLLFYRGLLELIRVLEGDSDGS